ncbi:hypothetical protein NX059_008330 [Plenodomus lindquistii]|nr:hypothetical protein NX059_008330 [Plenodomus lindquistii]
MGSPDGSPQCESSGKFVARYQNSVTFHTSRHRAVKANHPVLAFQIHQLVLFFLHSYNKTMAASVNNATAQPSTNSDGLISPAPTVTPMKRKHSPSPSQSSVKEDRQAPTLPSKSPELVADTLKDSTTYGVYQHTVLEVSGQDGAELIIKSATYNDAYKAMRDHALQIIDGKVYWGATSERTTDGINEIIDSRQHVQLRYDISPIHTTATNADGTAIWQRGKASTTPPKHFGVYFSLHPQDNDKGQMLKNFLGGYTDPAQAAYAMSISARMYLARHSGSTVRENRIDLIDRAGQIAQRFWIEQGRLVNGAFMKEDEWKAMPDVTLIPPAMKGRENRHSVLRIPSPDTNTPHPFPPSSMTTPLPPPLKSATLPTPTPKDFDHDEDADSDSDPSRPWCSCRQPDDGSKMLCCSNENKCPVKWYHARCLGFANVEEGWVCGVCDGDSARKGGKKAAARKMGGGKFAAGKKGGAGAGGRKVKKGKTG